MSNQLWDTLCQMCDEARDKWGVSAQEIADTLQQHRSNVSRELNRLVKHGLVEKKRGALSCSVWLVHQPASKYSVE